jgi:multidrug efflux pump
VISTALGSSYVNDFPSAGRLQRVVVQADAPARMQPDDLLRLSVANNKGQAWCRCRPSPAHAGSPGRCRPCATTATRPCASAAARRRARAPARPWPRWSGWPRSCRRAFGFEWTGLSREEKLAGSQAMFLYGFAILAVFLCLAALYESWSIPLAVILVVPLGVLGVLLATLTCAATPTTSTSRSGLITIIGLSAKNAILIIEFAKDLQAQGKGVIASALAAAHLRFRPIVMTSMAFTLGVLPLAISTGAGSASQRAIGTGVIGGILSGTALAVLFVPIFFVVVRGLFKDSPRQQQVHAEQAAHMGVHSDCPTGHSPGGPISHRQCGHGWFARAHQQRWHQHQLLGWFDRHRL